MIGPRARSERPAPERRGGGEPQQPAAESLLISLAVIMAEILRNRAPKRCPSEEDYPKKRTFYSLISLAIRFDPLSMSRLLGAISANCHAAPAARPASGLICKEQRAHRSLARLNVSEVL